MLKSMRKPYKYTKNGAVGDQSSLDADELQLLDECNSGWAKMWKSAAKKQVELVMGVATLAEREKNLSR
jgi:hypothetical protein